MKPEMYARAAVAQQTRALPVLSVPPRQYWWCRDRFFWEEENLTPEDVYALVVERDRRKERQLARAHAVMQADYTITQPKREVIPVEVRRAVFERDGGRCVACGSNFELQYDHVIPLSMGGASTAQNLQLLCAPCNQSKGATLG